MSKTRTGRIKITNILFIFLRLYRKSARIVPRAVMRIAIAVAKEGPNPPGD